MTFMDANGANAALTHFQPEAQWSMVSQVFCGPEGWSGCASTGCSSARRAVAAASTATDGQPGQVRWSWDV